MSYVRKRLTLTQIKKVNLWPMFWPTHATELKKSINGIIFWWKIWSFRTKVLIDSLGETMSVKKNRLKTLNIKSWNPNTSQKKWSFSIKDFFSKCDQSRSFLRIWSHLLKKSLIENFIFCTVRVIFRHPELFKPLTTNVLHHIETSQLIYIANQLTGFIWWGI